MRVGFTGSRYGLTRPQLDRLVYRLASSGRAITAFHCGDCVGADQLALVTMAAISGNTILHTHPGEVADQWKANMARQYRGLEIVEHPILPPLERNRVIVDAVDLVVACPQTMEPTVRGGTWATVNYARTRPVALTIIYPDGSEGK